MAKAKKTEEPVDAVVVEPVEVKRELPKKRQHTGSIFWGFAFIFVGALLLLDNLGVVTVQFSHLWQLWPILVIGAGVSLLSLRGWFGCVITFLLAIAFGVLAYLVAVENPFYDVDSGIKRQVSVVSAGLQDAGKGLNLTLKTGAVDLTLDKTKETKAFTATLESNNLSLRQEETTTRDGTQYVTLTTEAQRGWWIGSRANSLRVGLTDTLPLALRVETGAASVKGDLSEVYLKTLSVKTGASSIQLKLGTNEAKQTVTVEAGASSVVLSVPASAGVRIETDDGLSRTDFAGLTKVSEGVYESADFGTAEKQITIQAKIGVSSFELKRY